MRIRPAEPDDLAGIVAIQNHYVLHATATLRSEPHTLDQRRVWLERFGAGGPRRLLVATADGSVLGYASCGPYNDGPGFEHTVETSVNVAPDRLGQGIGSALYRDLFRAIDGQGLHRALAAIVLPNDASVALHRKFGFRDVGVFDEYGRKWGRYWSSLWMEKPL